jgi:D-inositol-3-phosphate glycosyltransferase
MRILLISDHADPLVEIGSREAGGQNVYVLYLSKHLAKLGISVDIFTRWDRKSKKEVVQVNNLIRVIRVKAGPRKYMPKENFINVIDEFSHNILKRIEKENLEYDLIHANYWFSGLIALKVNERIKKPIVYVFHSIGQVRFNTFKGRGDLEEREDEHYKTRTRAEKEIAQKSAGIISSSPVEKQLIKKLFRIEPEKIKMIPIGVDKKIFRPMKMKRARKILKIPESEKCILYVGRIEWRKGLGVLLFAFHNIARLDPEVKLYIIGGGKSKGTKKMEEGEWERIRKNSEDLGVGDRVIFLGPQQQKKLRKYYCAFDVCVVPSYYEPFGIVPLESMACGTPVVASNTGGLKYTVKENVTGHLFQPGNSEDLAGKIYLTIKNGKNFYRSNCLKRIHEFFEWEEIAKAYQDYFNELIK